MIQSMRLKDFIFVKEIKIPNNIRCKKSTIFVLSSTLVAYVLDQFISASLPHPLSSVGISNYIAEAQCYFESDVFKK